MTIAEQLRREGIQQGVKQGEKKASLAFARQLIADGMGRLAIKRYTGLTDNEINALTQQ